MLICMTTQMMASLGHCVLQLEQKAYFQQVPLDEMIEVDSLYATYAHDPRPPPKPLVRSSLTVT